MNKNIKRHLLEAVLLLSLSSLVVCGCATVGYEIREMFGEPWRIGIEDGRITWTYARYHYRLFGDASTTDLIVRFNAAGVVDSYSYNTAEAENAP